DSVKMNDSLNGLSKTKTIIALKAQLQAKVQLLRCKPHSGIHHKTFSRTSSTIQQKLVYGTANDALQETHSIVHRLHRDIYGEREGPFQLSVSFGGSVSIPRSVWDSLSKC
ncbi:hypothetical protein LSAT2_002593, partial [Lamellibrachia satsuma]